MTVFRPHQKQFILGPRPVSVWPDWVAINVADNLVLSACPKLNITRLRSRDGVTYYLLGLALLADQAMKTVAEVFPSKDSSEIEDWTGFWAGKWALICATCIWPDATVCLGICYRKVGGAVWISSSPALLGDHIPNAPSEPFIAWQVRHRTGIDWVPVPLTTRENVYKLMALRTIHPITGATRPVKFSAAADDASADDQSFAAAFKTIMANWARTDFREHYMSLTAGIDTRTIVAAGHANGLTFETRTVNYPEASKSDIAMPPRIAASVGLRHKLIRRPNPPLDLSEIMARTTALVEHMDGATYHPGAAAYAHGLDDFMHDAGRTMTVGHIFALGRCFYWKRMAHVGLGEALPSADQVLTAFFTRSDDLYAFWSSHPRSRWREAMQLWLDSLAEPRAIKLDWREAFHLDQQQGGWSSSIHRLMDIHDGHYFIPANCLWVLHLMVRESVARKKDSFVQKNAIRILSPGLSRFPVNPPTRAIRVKRVVKTLLGEKGTRKVKSYAERIRAH